MRLNDDVTDTSDAGTDATDTTITDITDPDTTETDNPLDENPNDMTDPTDDPTTLIITPTPMLSLEKSITMVNDLDGNGIDQGDTVDYSFEVTNTGNTTLSNVSIDDATIGVTGLVVSPSMLAPGAVGTATASLHSYTVQTLIMEVLRM